MTGSIYDEPTGNDDQVEPLVGEGRKFKTQEDLEHAKREADRFILQLQEELKTARTEILSAKKIEELIKGLKPDASTGAPQGSSERSSNEQPNLNNQATLSKEDIAKLVKQSVGDIHSQATQQQNIQYAVEELKKVWGNNYVQKLKSVGAQVGLSEAHMDELAKTAPKALIALVAPQNKENVSGYIPPRSSVGQPQGAPQSSKGWEYYESLKTSNPKQYWSAKVQGELHRRVLAGEIVVPT